ncbi:hypothetical protein FHR81_002945 [Actinoalloteichus hoggarensis]|uniref:Uncharacterized protein n=1 Tax=Actinoalloteichus hoggarensis TaxID=1470176 RepID=A0A221VYG2_9PSEU|nr:DUF4041 domain-containing protein [Actinoalloteichus hoggarensis]ASO18537.1 Hypothetical protein AHOG_04405 [Actinoalloteichus hoggarensis]MBB5921905.1 hypothetical protein [Actinoalloteichus hoggarensis]
MFGGRKRRQQLDEALRENQHLRDELRRLGGLGPLGLRNEIDALTRRHQTDRARFQQEISAMNAEVARLNGRLTALRAEVVETDDARLMQEVGVYQYRHVLSDAEAYKDRLALVKDTVKNMTRSKSAVDGSQDFHYNNSLAQGRKFVGELSKLMLRAYNAEAENCVRVLKAGNLASAVKRLETAVRTIEKLGAMAAIRINPAYHATRIRELELTADYLARKQQEKEAERERRAALREEQRALQEYRREQERLLKEQGHYRNAAAALRAKGDEEGAADLERKLAEIAAALGGIEEREANIRAGYVYVISNIGSFGPDVVKIGMTRRLEPMDRVRELGDASVPFRFDVHALFFSPDAVTIERQLHAALESRRLNRVNRRREYFRCTPTEVKTLLHDLAGSLLDYRDDPEAVEYRQSLGAATATAV